MRKIILMAALAVLLAGCGHRGAIIDYKARDYQWHKNTIWIKVHWNYLRSGEDTIVAEGYVEPFSPRNGVYSVRLVLVGLDEAGNEVSSASGSPADVQIISPVDESGFRIEMKLTGREKDFGLRGDYYYFRAGKSPELSSRTHDYIPLKSDEDY